MFARFCFCPAYSQPVPDVHRLRFPIFFVCNVRIQLISPDFNRMFSGMWPDRFRIRIGSDMLPGMYGSPLLLPNSAPTVGPSWRSRKQNYPKQASLIEHRIAQFLSLAPISTCSTNCASNILSFLPPVSFLHIPYQTMHLARKCVQILRSLNYCFFFAPRIIHFAESNSCLFPTIKNLNYFSDLLVALVIHFCLLRAYGATMTPSCTEEKSPFDSIPWAKFVTICALNICITWRTYY